VAFSSPIRREGAPVLNHSVDAQILIVSQEECAIRLLSSIGHANGWHLEIATSGWEALERVRAGTAPDATILDLAQDEGDGLHTLRWMRRVRPDMHVLLLAPSDNPEQKMEALRLGAEEYLVYPLQEQQLEAAIRRHLSSGENSDVYEEVEQITHDQYFVAAGVAMRKLRAQLEMLAQVSTPLLILGENGTGKELAARLVHRLSVRSGFRFFKLNCAALSGDVLENELFGFRNVPGDSWNQVSKFEICHRGTLFLNEITAIPPRLQLRLLTVLQDGYLKGDNDSTIGVDVRIVGADSGNLERAISDRKLLEDLYCRLSAFTVRVPPLRERREEIPLLLGHFMNQMARKYGLQARTFSANMLAACQQYDWPGNLRELQEFVKRHLLVGENGGTLTVPEHNRVLAHDNSGHDVSRAEVRPNGTPCGLKLLLQSVKGDTERNAVAAALERTSWNRKAAARLLKVSYRTLLYKIEQYRMIPPENTTKRTASHDQSLHLLENK
jgi:two-component system, NtrC family, response regulator AtoC